MNGRLSHGPFAPADVKKLVLVLVCALIVVVILVIVVMLMSRQHHPIPQSAYLGFDRNDYPGDDKLPILRKTFAYTGYWLNTPPGDPNGNLWAGKRATVQAAGFGFLVLFKGKSYSELRRARSAVESGKADAAAAVKTCHGEGFPSQTVIFLDQEEGGPLLPAQQAYVLAWIDEVNSSGFRAGIYCSGMPVTAGGGKTVTTAEDLHRVAGDKPIVYWITNDACAPSPGCVFGTDPPLPRASGIPFATIWQFVQSPRRRHMTFGCANTYHSDGRCYPPGITPDQGIDVDVNTASSADPSGGRTSH
jgi:Domain of unknown function (DUF1906)